MGGCEYKRRLTTSVRETPASNLMKKHGPGRVGGVRKSDEEREMGRGTNEVKSQEKGGRGDWMWPGMVGGNSQC